MRAVARNTPLEAEARREARPRGDASARSLTATAAPRRRAGRRGGRADAEARADEVRRLEGEWRGSNRAPKSSTPPPQARVSTKGPRAILARRKEDRRFLPGFRGLLLDLFDVGFDEARAIEAALGDAASAIVVETVAEALEGIRFLREGLHGGASSCRSSGSGRPRSAS